MITTCLWFDTEAEEAAEFWCSVIPGSKVGEVTRYTEADPERAGTVITVAFELDGKPYVGLNGGPVFPFTEAVSLQVMCADQAEVDHYWSALLADGGVESQCGWLKDRFGFSWQVVPTELPALLADPDPERARRAAESLYTMQKIDLATIRAAADAS